LAQQASSPVALSDKRTATAPTPLVPPTHALTHAHTHSLSHTHIDIHMCDLGSHLLAVAGVAVQQPMSPPLLPGIAAGGARDAAPPLRGGGAAALHSPTAALGRGAAALGCGAAGVGAAAAAAGVGSTAVCAAWGRTADMGCGAAVAGMWGCPAPADHARVLLLLGRCGRSPAARTATAAHAALLGGCACERVHVRERVWEWRRQRACGGKPLGRAAAARPLLAARRMRSCPAAAAAAPPGGREHAALTPRVPAPVHARAAPQVRPHHHAAAGACVRCVVAAVRVAAMGVAAEGVAAEGDAAGVVHAPAAHAADPALGVGALLRQRAPHTHIVQPGRGAAAAVG